jgi:hypothetical protein
LFTWVVFGWPKVVYQGVPRSIAASASPLLLIPKANYNEHYFATILEITMNIKTIIEIKKIVLPWPRTLSLYA